MAAGRVDLVFVGRAHTVWRALVDLQLSTLDDLGAQELRRLDRDNLVIISVQKPLPIIVETMASRGFLLIAVSGLYHAENF